ncbi:MAG: translation initiation factor IF-3 [Lachnospirales bacterium]
MFKQKLSFSPVTNGVHGIHFYIALLFCITLQVDCVHLFLCPLPGYVNYKNYRRCTTIPDSMINDQIRDKEVRLISETGEQLGIYPSAKARELAYDKNLDLVKISPNAKPPVCKIMDYSKFKFEQSKKAKEARKKQKTIEVKELRLSPNIDKHDVDVKVKHAIKFLKSGDKVKITIRFRGRELGHTDFGREILANFATAVEEFGFVEKAPKMEARSMAMFLAPHADK